jgi:hypothetical protein
VDPISKKEYILNFLSASGVLKVFCLNPFQLPSVEWVCFKAILPRRE